MWGTEHRGSRLCTDVASEATGKCERIGLSRGCRLGAGSRHQIVTVEDIVVLRAKECPGIKSDCTMLPSWAAARSAVLPSENRKVAKTNTEREMLQLAVV